MDLKEKGVRGCSEAYCHITGHLPNGLQHTNSGCRCLRSLKPVQYSLNINRALRLLHQRVLELERGNLDLKGRGVLGCGEPYCYLLGKASKETGELNSQCQCLIKIKSDAERLNISRALNLLHDKVEELEGLYGHD